MIMKIRTHLGGCLGFEKSYVLPPGFFLRLGGGGEWGVRQGPIQKLFRAHTCKFSFI